MPAEVTEQQTKVAEKTVEKLTKKQLFVVVMSLVFVVATCYLVPQFLEGGEPSTPVHAETKEGPSVAVGGPVHGGIVIGKDTDESAAAIREQTEFFQEIDQRNQPFEMPPSRAEMNRKHEPIRPSRRGRRSSSGKPDSVVSVKSSDDLD